MPDCKRIKSERREVCIGDMDRLITLQIRDIKAPGTSDPNNQYYFTEAFSDAPNPQVWAMRKSVDGKNVFDGQNIERTITDEFYIRYDSNVTSQIWIEDDGERFDIATVEDLDGRKEFMMLNCINRGIDTNTNTRL